MEGSIYDSRRVIQANGYVFWTDELTGNFLDYDEWNSLKYYQYWKSGKLYRWCNSRNGRRERT